MKRREFLRGAAAAGVATAAASTFPTPALSQGRIEVKMVTTWPKGLPGLGTGAQRLSDRITAMSGGRITVTTYAAGELVGAFDSFDAVSQGNAEAYHGAEYYWQGKSKAFNFFTAVPFGLTASELNAWIYHGGGQELWDELAADFGLKPFLAGNTGVQMGGWFAREVKTLDDFRGLKFRMPGLGGEVLRRMGAAVIALPGGEIFPALQSGAIDATEWVGPWNDLAFGFYKVVQYYYFPGFHEPGSGLSFAMSKRIWDGLPDGDKEMIKAACAAENDIMLAEFNARNNDALTTLVRDHGVKLRKMSDQLLNEIGKYSGEVMAETAAEGGITKRVYDSFIGFRKGAIRWSRISDQAYWDARLLPFNYG